MIQVVLYWNEDGQDTSIFLDLYDVDTPQITMEFDSFETFQPISTYTKTFRVPATDNNYNFFKDAFEINGYDFDVTQKINAEILVDGESMMTGYIRLNKIYYSFNDRIDYEIMFLGEVSNFVNSLGSKTLQNLDLTELNHVLNMTNVIKSWEAYPSAKDVDGNDITPDVDNGLVLGGDVPNGTIIYPLVDFGNDYDSNELTENVSISNGTSLHITNPDVANYQKLWADRFKPMIRTKYLIDKIFSEAGYTYTSNFLSAVGNPFFRTYISAWGNEPNIYTSSSSNDTLVRLSEVWYPPAELVSRIPLDYEIYDYPDAWNNETYVYNSPVAGLNTILFSINATGIKSYGSQLYIRVKKNTSVIHVLEAPTNSNTFSIYLSDSFDVSPSDDITLELVRNDLEGYHQLLSCSFTLNAPGELNVSSLLESDYKQIDFIKDIFTFYKLVMVPDKKIPNNFIIETWDNYIATGELRDWTGKVDLSKDIEIIPLFLEQKSRNIFTTPRQGDWLNDLNDKTFSESFGELKIITNNDLLIGEKKITTNIASTPVSEIQGAKPYVSGFEPREYDNMIIPHIYTLEAGDTRALRKPMKPKTRMLYYNGMKQTEQDVFIPNAAKWYYRNDDLTSGSTSYFPMVSPYQYMPFDYFNPTIDGDSVSSNLTWQVENGYLRFGTLNPGVSLYDQYWLNYFDLLFNKNSRRVRLNIVLDTTDLFDFQFKDVIFIKDTYYFVEKIENIKYGEKTSVRVSLIKLINYNVDTGGFIPQGNIWDDVSDTWNVTTYTWND